MQWLFLSLILLFSGCSSPQLRVKNDKSIGVVFSHGSTTFAAKKELSDSIVLDGVFIERSLYVVDTSQVLVYEHAKTLPPYAFQYDVLISLRIIFERTSVEQLGRIGNLGFYAIAFKDGGPLYAIAENENKRGIGIIYGLNKEQIEMMMAELGKQTPHTLAAMGGGIVLPRSSAAFLSRWSPKMIIADGLLRRTGGSPYIRFGKP